MGLHLDELIKNGIELDLVQVIKENDFKVSEANNVRKAMNNMTNNLNNYKP